MNDITECVRQDPKGQRYELAKAEYFWRIRDLTANLMRVAAGAGKEYELAEQLIRAVEAQAKYGEAARDAGMYDHLDSPLGEWRSGPWAQERALSDTPQWQQDGTLGRMIAQDGICVASLRIVASGILGQSSHKSTAESALYGEIRALEAAREEQRKSRL